MTTVSTTFCFLSGIKNSIQLFTVSITVGVILNNGDKHLLFFFFFFQFWLCWVFGAVQAFLQLWRVGATL